ncbi:hypothetical protein N1851_002886 [Merluccius polli]|uniref:Uncharacterized protein n=1 Tax=Merluccius polli TaxID=89951 RepID=A0AA47NAT7_MERPO|nr:hypothetical protein N1851_012352 [Merluccius polli]KAK0154800.1 hypothetical protein N1851_002886 [Merluccius polli]
MLTVGNQRNTHGHYDNKQLTVWLSHLKRKLLKDDVQGMRCEVYIKEGAASSPGCVNYGLKQLAKNNESLFPLGSQFIMKDFYVDDGVTSIASADDAIQLAKEVQELCAMAQVCNNGSVLESIPPSECAVEMKALDLAFNNSTLERALGIQWHHPFSDASTYGYGQCLRHVNEDVHCALVMGKSRVAPIKVTTIPRLELTAAVVSVSASNTLKEELGLAKIDEYFWTDSKVVLGYINNKACYFHTFVWNTENTSQHWTYVFSSGHMSLLTITLQTLPLEVAIWFTGPQFLWEKEIPSVVEVITEIQIGDPEVKRIQTLNTDTLKQVSLSDSNCLTMFLAEKQCDFSMNAPHSSLGETNQNADNLSDPDSPEPLTHNHLLTIKPIVALPPPGRFIREDMYTRKRWHHVQYLLESLESFFNVATRQR